MAGIISTSALATREGFEETTAELVERASHSDDAAWRALVERFGGLVWSIIRSCGLSPSDGADVSQTVWLRLVDNLDRLRERDRVGAWLSTSTRHECIRVSRIRQRSVPTATDDFDAIGRMVDDDPAAALATKGRDAAVREVVASMPARSQTLLGLLMADPPVSYADIGARLGVPVGSIGPTRQRCLRTLQARCVAAGIEP